VGRRKSYQHEFNYNTNFKELANAITTATGGVICVAAAGTRVQANVIGRALKNVSDVAPEQMIAFHVLELRRAARSGYAAPGEGHDIPIPLALTQRVDGNILQRPYVSGTVPTVGLAVSAAKTGIVLRPATTGSEAQLRMP